MLEGVGNPQEVSPMKHDLKITLVLLAMFLATQIIGLIVIDAYSPLKTIQVKIDGKVVEKTTGGNITLPYNMEPPKMGMEVVPSIMISILLATLIFFVLTRLNAALIIRAWFFFVVLITTSISLTALLSKFHPAWDKVLTMSLGYPLTLISVIALAMAFVLAFYKIVKRNFLIHNFTELLIYPGLAAIFVPLFDNLNEPKVLGIYPPIFWCVILLLAISLYDAYAVWKSKHMISLAKYQIQNLKLFTGFFLPYVSNKSFEQIKKLKESKDIKMRDVKKETQKIKISLAILGGGDVAFPLIFAGIVLRASSFLHALIVAVAVTISLLLLFIVAKKEKFYPAMPFLTAGCIAGYLLTLLF